MTRVVLERADKVDPIMVSEAVSIARQIAEALEAAHEEGRFIAI